MLAAAVIGVPSAHARMTVVYDVVASVQALTGLQPGGGAGLWVEDGLFQQQPATPVLPASRQVGKVSGGVGSALTPSILGMSAQEMADLFRARVDAAGARLVFVDELGQSDSFGGADGVNLEGAMSILATTPFAAGESYADRVHMYVNIRRPLFDPKGWGPFWGAMARSGGVWIEAYEGKEQWPAERWLAWPRTARDNLVARGFDPTRLHVIVRGSGMDVVWQNMRTGAACDLLANGPGAYRIEDQAGFVGQFRATFGSAPAPPGPSPITCTPAPTLPAATADALAGVLEMERTGATVPHGSIPTDPVAMAAPGAVHAALGSDPLGLAARLGADPGVFWGAAGAVFSGSGPGGAPALDLDGAALRQALGPAADLRLSLQAHTTKLGDTLERILANPTTWRLAIPLLSAPPGVAPPTALHLAPTIRIRVRILRRGVGTKLSVVELRFSRKVTRQRVEVGFVAKGRYRRGRVVSVTGLRAVVRVRIPLKAVVRARLL